MAQPGLRTVTRIEAAAQMRAAGISWAEIAQKLGLREEAAKNWTQKYPDLWAESYRSECERMLHETRDLCVQTVRNRLGDNNGHVALKAASIGLNHFDRQCGPQHQAGGLHPQNIQINLLSSCLHRAIAQELARRGLLSENPDLAMKFGDLLSVSDASGQRGNEGSPR